MNNFSQEQVLTTSSEKVTLGQIWNNHPPIIHWCIGLTCLSLGAVYTLLLTML